MQDYWQHLEAENIQRVKMWAAKDNFIQHESFTKKNSTNCEAIIYTETIAFPGTQSWQQPT